VRVSAGTQVTTGGTTLLGDQRVDVEAGEGPEFEVRAWGALRRRQDQRQDQRLEAVGLQARR
jgi:hypothetical protein